LLVLLALAPLLLLALAPSASAAPPVASFSYAPTAPLTLETVTFTSMSAGNITSQSWDLDGDGVFDDASGSKATTTFPRSGTYRIGLQVVGPPGQAEQFQNVAVANRPPNASILVLPATPVEGSPVSLVSMSTDPDGGIALQQWDLDNDGAFDDGSGALVALTLPAGAHIVRLRIVDSDGAEAIAEVLVPVAEKAAQFLNPFPVVRLVGRTTRTGILIRRLTVQAPSGSRVKVRCRGRGCPRRSQVLASDVLRFRRFERRLRARAVLEVFVTNPNAIGKYTRFKVRKGKAPRRRDLCIPIGGGTPLPCPT
jgi:PKD domain-containing protein